MEIWSDVVCPWCYIGKRRFEGALARFEHRDHVTVHWRAFELDPHAPARTTGTAAQRLAAKYGRTLEQAQEMHANVTRLAAQEGLTFDYDRAQGGNTFDAHRLIQLAAEQGVQDAVKERLMRAYFTEAEPIGDPQVLVRLTTEAGLEANAARALLAGDEHAGTVRSDEALARQLGISGVPFFVLDRRVGVSGAQSPQTLLAALEQAFSAPDRDAA